MIKHIVMWTLKDRAADASAEDNALKLKQILGTLRETISEIREIEVGINFSSSEAACDVVLYSVFANREALEAYQKHPHHQSVVDFVKEISSQRHVVDYEV